MRRKLFQIGKWYLRFDITIIDRFNVLLGINYVEGMYKACLDEEMTKCFQFRFAEQQIGFFFCTFSIGKEELVEPENEEDDAA